MGVTCKLWDGYSYPDSLPNTGDSLQLKGENHRHESGASDPSSNASYTRHPRGKSSLSSHQWKPRGLILEEPVGRSSNSGSKCETECRGQQSEDHASDEEDLILNPSPPWLIVWSHAEVRTTIQEDCKEEWKQRNPACTWSELMPDAWGKWLAWPRHNTCHHQIQHCTGTVWGRCL